MSREALVSGHRTMRSHPSASHVSLRGQVISKVVVACKNDCAKCVTIFKHGKSRLGIIKPCKCSWKDAVDEYDYWWGFKC